MSFGWADLSSLASNLAEKGTSFLAELDERIEGDEIEDSRDIGSDEDDEEDKDLPSWSRTSPRGADEPDVSELQRKATVKREGSTDGASSASPQKAKDIQALQEELQQVKGMREDLKLDVAGQFEHMSREMHASIATLGFSSRGSTGADPASAGAGSNAADAALLARAELAEERLASAEVALHKLRAAMQANIDEVTAAREAEVQFAKHKAKMQTLVEEKEEAEAALRNLTKMQSVEREELTQQLQDLQSAASAERQYGQSKAEECKALKSQLTAAAEQMAQISKDHTIALSSMEQATMQVEKDGDYTGLCARLEAQDTHVALQEQVLQETRTQLDIYIKTAAEAERQREEILQEMGVVNAQLAAAQGERQRLHQDMELQLEQAASAEKALRSQLKQSEAKAAANEQAEMKLAAEVGKLEQREQGRLAAFREIQKENSDLHQVAADLEQRLQEADAVTAAAREAASQTTQQSAQTALAVEESADLAATLKQQVEDLQAQNALTALAAEESADLAATLKQQVEDLQAQNALTALAAEESADLAATLKQQVEDLQAQNADWEASAEAATAARKQEVLLSQKAVQEANQRVSDAIEQGREASVASQAQHTQEIEAKEKEVSALEKRLHDYFAEAATQGSATQSFQEELEAKAEQLAATHAEVARERARAEKAETQASNMAAQHALELSAHQAKEAEAQEAHRKQQEEQATAVVAAQAEVVKANKKVERSTENLKNALSKAVELNTALAQTKAQAQAAETAFDRTLKERDSRHASALEASLREHAAEMQRTLEENVQALEASHSELLQSKSAQAEIQRTLEENVQALEASHSELLQSKSAQAEMQRTLEENAQAQEELQLQCQQAEHLAHSLKLALDEAKEGLNRGQSDLETQLALKHSQLEVALADLQATEVAAAAATADNDSKLEAQQAALQAALAQLEQHSAQHATTHDIFQKELGTKHAELEAALAALDAQQAEQREKDTVYSEQLEVKHASLEAALSDLDRARSAEAEAAALAAAAGTGHEELSHLLEVHRTRADQAEASLVQLREEHERDISIQIARFSTLDAEHTRKHELFRAVEEQHAALLSESANREKEYLSLQSSYQQQQKQWTDRLEELELAAQDRTVDNASMREQVRMCDETIELLQAQRIADQQQIRALANSQAESVGAGQAALQQLEAQLQQQSEATAEAQGRAQAAAASQNNLTSKLGNVEAQLAQAQAAAAQASEYLTRCEAAESELSKLEAKKGRDLESLKAQNSMVASLKAELEEAREARVDAEDALAAAQQELSSAISPDAITQLQHALQQEQESTRKIRGLYEALQAQVAQSAAAHGGQMKSDEVAEAHLRMELVQAREQLAGLLAQTLVTASKETETEKIITMLRAELAAEHASSESTAAQNRQYIQKLEGERARLENELHESSAGVARASLHVPGSRQRGSNNAASSASNSPFHHSSAPDLEAGVALLADDDDDGSRKQGDPIPAVINTVWRQAAKYPALLQYIGETPPRLGPLGRGLFGYIVVLHLLLVFGVV